MEPRCALAGTADRPVLRLIGVWRLSGLEVLDAELSRIVAAIPGTPAGLTLDGSRLDAIDTAGAALIVRRLAALGISPGALGLERFTASHRRILDVVTGRLASPTVAAERPQGRAWPSPALASETRPGRLATLGAASLALGRLVAGHVGFLGLVLVELARLVRRPASLRGRELAAQFARVCLGAIPVILLVTFLIGTIVAYLLGQQAEQYGASIFVVDGVALGMVREFSPLIVATIVAGRSGAAFTAQLGTMRLTEEIDAIRTLGLSPEQVLVLPRVLALVVSLPLLVFAGDVAGLAGAMFVSDVMLGLTPHTFVERVGIALDARHYLIGLAKAPVFALWIAVIGCRMGMAVSRDTRSIGVNTTSTVVQSIVAVILLDAAFAVVLQELGL